MFILIKSANLLLSLSVLRYFTYSFPEQLWVLDSVPGEVNPDNSDGEVEKVLHTLRSLPSSLPSRKYALLQWFIFDYVSDTTLSVHALVQITQAHTVFFKAVA